MADRKPRILLVNEFSHAASGYATMGMELQKRLAATGRYELAELACYADPSSPQTQGQADDLPWRVYFNSPATPAEQAAYNAAGVDQFGAFAFERVCREFRPDIVWSFRDHWMDAWIEESPYRPFFHWAHMPTVDAEPQMEAWLATYAAADAILTYTDWGGGVLKREGGGTIPRVGSASPGVDTEVFRPMDRAAIRHKFSIDEDDLIIGTTMRNQGRKLYPELIEAFGAFLRQAPPEIARRSYLYLHTSYPDSGWDLPDLIKRSGFARRIYVTYKCKACMAVMPMHYADAMASCPSCGKLAACPTNVKHGVDRPTLAMIYNLFDAYVQYASNEGFGVPMVEAAACGVPVFAVDYSAMSDVVRKVNGQPIGVLAYRTEPETGRRLAVPDNEDLVAELDWFLRKSAGLCQLDAQLARRGVLDHYTWERSTAAWTAVFDSLPLRDWSRTWESPSRATTPIAPPHQFPSNETMVRWCLAHFAGRPDLVDSYMSLRLIKDLNWGSTRPRYGRTYQNEECMLGSQTDLTEFGPEQMLNELAFMVVRNNEADASRLALIGKWSEAT